MAKKQECPLAYWVNEKFKRRRFKNHRRNFTCQLTLMECLEVMRTQLFRPYPGVAYVSVYRPRTEGEWIGDTAA